MSCPLRPLTINDQRTLKGEVFFPQVDLGGGLSLEGFALGAVIVFLAYLIKSHWKNRRPRWWAGGGGTAGLELNADAFDLEELGAFGAVLGAGGFLDGEHFGFEAVIAVVGGGAGYAGESEGGEEWGNHEGAEGAKAGIRGGVKSGNEEEDRGIRDLGLEIGE